MGARSQKSYIYAEEQRKWCAAMSKNQSKRPSVPIGWEVRGEFPDVDPATVTEEQLDLLTEDLYQTRLEGNKFVLDIGWHPEADRGGRYTGRLIEANDWENPVEELQTNNRGEVLAWAEETMEAVSARMGEADTFSDETVMSFIVPALPSVETLMSSLIVPALPSVPDSPTHVPRSDITVPSSVSTEIVQRAEA
jgi:hypothetical protein